MNKLKYDYNKVKTLMDHERNVKHWSKKDLQLIQEAKETDNWKKVYNSKLYNKYGGEYCSLLEVLERC